MKAPTMCATHSCSMKGVKRTVLGGCEECGSPLVEWDDPDKPSIETLAQLVVSVALFDGRVIPLEPVEDTLRRNPDIRIAWEQRHAETQKIIKGEA